MMTVAIKYLKDADLRYVYMLFAFPIICNKQGKIINTIDKVIDKFAYDQRKWALVNAIE